MRIVISISRIYYKLTLLLIFLAMDLFIGRFVLWYDDVSKLLACAFCLIGCVWEINCEQTKKNLFIAFIILITMTFFSLLNGMPISTTIGIWLRFFTILGFVLWAVNQGYDVLRDAFDFLFLFTVISLVFFLLFDYGLSNVNYTVETYYGLHNDVHTARNYMGIYYRTDDQITRVLYGIKMLTANGLWNEPGAYVIFPSFALFYALFLGKGIRTYKIVILSLAIITAQSTMGILILIVMIAIKGFEVFKNLVIRIVASIVLMATSYILIRRLIQEKMTTTNWFSRINNFQRMIDAIKQSPIIGSGQKYDIWSGLFNYFVNYGLIIGSLVVGIIIIRGVLKNSLNTSKFGVIAFVVWWLLCMINEPYGYNNLLFIIYSILIIGTDVLNTREYEDCIIG